MKKKKRGIIAIISLTAIMMGCGTPEQNDIAADHIEMEEISLDNINEGALTDAEKAAKYTAYLQETLGNGIEDAYPAVRSAAVTLSETDDRAQAMVSLELQEELAQDNVSEIAQYIATAIGAPSTDDVVIRDTEGTVLFQR